MHKFLFDYVKLKFGGKAKLRFMNKDSSIIYIKTKILPQILQKMLKQDLILQIMNQANHYPDYNIKAIVELKQDELGEKTREDFSALRPKIQRYLIGDRDENNKARV